MITGLGFAFGEGGGWRQRLVNLAACRLYRLALRGNALVIFQNPDDLALFRAERLLRDTGRVLVVNGSGVDLDEFCQAPPITAPHFLMAARLIKAKGVYDYVEAGRILRRQYPAARFRLAGDIDESQGAIRPDELAAWKATGEIDHLGWLDDVRPALAASAVYVLPSYREGTPRSALEAMAMGRPIVTTDTPGCRETVVNGMNGFLVPPRNPAALARALARFVEEPALIGQMGAASRRLAEAKYDVHAVNRAILDGLGP
jgi:glycosyltransferase involved in cell wall biosynthesis